MGRIFKRSSHHIFVRSLIIRHSNGLSLQKWHQKYELEAVATLSEQLVNAMANYISGCHEIPIEKSCDFSSSSMDTIKSEIADKRELAKVLVWNKNLEIVEVLSFSNNLKSQKLSKHNEPVLLIHEMGESSCSDKMRKLIKESYRKKPETAVITLDYSSVVSCFSVLYLWL